jgi:hypothetical protein
VGPFDGDRLCVTLLEACLIFFQNDIAGMAKVAGIGSACGLGTSPTPGLRESARAAARTCKYRRAARLGCAMGLSGRLLFDISNRGLC